MNSSIKEGAGGQPDNTETDHFGTPEAISLRTLKISSDCLKVNQQTYS
jgi:hypothetical protein